MSALGEKVTKINLLANFSLFILKIYFGILLLSLAIMADALNSFSDIFASLAILYTFKIGRKEPDANHPFGHARAEPIGALIVAIFIGIVGFEVVRFGVFDILEPSSHIFSFFGIVVLLITIVTKMLMAYYFKKIGKDLRSPAILATSEDSKNDVLSSTVALFGFVGTAMGYNFLDGLAAVIIGFWIIRSAVKLTKENIDYLMGATPEEKMLREIEKRAYQVEGVKEVHKVTAHYVGHIVNVEIHILLDGELTLKESHAIANKVQKKIEKMDDVNRAFVHVDPDMEHQ
ncbi:MAG TPA: cation transporter [Thermoplasmata archaeon]|nr:cation transporter [Thermoplasmata archaeon]